MTIPEILIWEATNVLLLIPRGDRVGDPDAVDTTPTAFHRTGLAVSDRPSTGKSSLASPLAKICGAMVRRGRHRIC